MGDRLQRLDHGSLLGPRRVRQGLCDWLTAQLGTVSGPEDQAPCPQCILGTLPRPSLGAQQYSAAVEAT
ncbi:hypothetical protein EYF80_005764 [Liparis tanakae]|uniref:Uncharacterized protein n=1 Tax=Liparis tanakae TaxID=230148 RepID=A0A4Z2J323_9TELE|nr:hypothetical protein EYF80_005764 [Liparis tanakae]